MAATAESDIVGALNAHLSGMSGAWPIAWPNVDFVPPASNEYLRVSFQPNEVETWQLSAGQYHFMGLYQVTVVTKLGKGELGAIAQASLVARRFEYLTALSCASGTVRIYQQPSVRPGMKSGDSYEIPVTIRYQLITD